MLAPTTIHSSHNIHQNGAVVVVVSNSLPVVVGDPEGSTVALQGIR